jgi:uncharacterized membrane protein YkoI
MCQTTTDRPAATLKFFWRPALAAWLVALAFAPVSSHAIQPGAAKILARLPAAVQRTILAEIGEGQLLDLHRSIEDGAVVFEVEMSRNNRTREFTVAATGELVDIQVYLDETPAAVQRTILAAANGGKVTDISKTLDAGKTIYDVEWVQGGRTRNFMVSADGQLLTMQVFLDETPPAVRETIAAQVGKGSLREINRTTDEGETVYDVEMTKGGSTRDFIVNAAGELFGLKVLLSETPAAVQKTIRGEVGGGKLLEIEKNTEEGKLVYDAKMDKDGRTRSFTVSADGDLLNSEVFLDETPAAVKQTILSQLRGGQLVDIYRTTDEGDVVYEVEITKGGKSRSLTVDANGALYSEEEPVALADTPPDVRNAIQSLLAQGGQADITRLKEEDEISYLVELKQGGKRQSLTLDASGKVIAPAKN